MVRKLILDRLADKRLSMKDASLKMGRAHSYLYQFLKKGIPLELNERDRHNLASILDVSEDVLRGPSTLLPKRNYEKNLMPRKSLVDPETLPPYSRQEHDKALAPDLFGKLDLPVYGTAQDGQGGAIVTRHPVGLVARPPSLMGYQEGYALIVTDDTMSPEHKMGSVALVHPNMFPKVGETGVFRCRSEDGTERILIREYRGESETHWKVLQHRSQQASTLKKSDWASPQKTVGNYAS